MIRTIHGNKVPELDYKIINLILLKKYKKPQIKSLEYKVYNNNENENTWIVEFIVFNEDVTRFESIKNLEIKQIIRNNKLNSLLNK